MADPAPPPVPPAPAVDAASTRGRRRPRLVRAIVEAAALLAVGVVTFHAFEVEGYVISSGSMAPGLFGFHKRVVCPSCEHTFARGVAFDPAPAIGWTDRDRMNADEPGAEDDRAEPATLAHCPNCGTPDIDVSAVPDNQGDQLLVLKHAYAWRSPRRWEVVVFRHPADARQAYVKRVVGLPGEAIRVAGGDVWANGRLCRKDWPAIRAVRIPVHDPDHAADEDGAPATRWSGAGWTTAPGAGAGEPVRFETTAGGDEPRRWRKLIYRHRLRAGGTHATRVTLSPLPPNFAWDKPALPRPYAFDPATGELACRGVLGTADRARLRRVSRHPRWRAAVDELAARSRFAPIADDYGYNAAPDPRRPERVRDFSLSLTADLSGDPAAALGLELTDGRARFLLVADRAAGAGGGTLALHRLADVGERRGGGGIPPALWTEPLPAALAAGPAAIEFSLFDRRALCAVNGAPVGPAASFERPADAPPPGDSPATVGARGTVGVSNLILYRDVHYTRGRAVHGVEEECRLGPGELFVLGDNSPVSLDSRGWEQGAVPERLLVGKPFLVHLPSRPGTLRWAGGETTVRIPDPSRVRWVR